MKQHHKKMENISDHEVQNIESAFQCIPMTESDLSSRVQSISSRKQKDTNSSKSIKSIKNRQRELEKPKRDAKNSSAKQLYFLKQTPSIEIQSMLEFGKHKKKQQRTSIENYGSSMQQLQLMKNISNEKKSQSQDGKELLKFSKKSNNNNTQGSKFIFENTNALGQVVKGQKIKMMVNNFVKKIGRSIVHNSPVVYEKFNPHKQEYFFDRQGFKQVFWLKNLLKLLDITLILILLIVQSLSLIFEGVLVQEEFFISIICMVYFVLEIGYNLTTEKISGGKKLLKLREIGRFYLSNGLITDVFSLLVIIIDAIINTRQTAFLILLIICKLPECFNKMEALEVQFIKNFYSQQYWSLIKVFLFNFAFAHILAIFLIAITSIDTNSNWMTVKNLNHAAWYDQYIWAYYWASTIMLTVGFGDIVPTNSKEALCILFIQTISCIVLAYNVNCVGTLISNIRSQDVEKAKQLKVFKKMTDFNQVPQEIQSKINNYIEESTNLKKKFNLEEENLFIEKLPEGLQKQYKRQANKNIIAPLMFFKNLLDKSLKKFAQTIQMKISHPEEIVRNLESDFNIIILKRGKFGYICKKAGCTFNDQVADQISVGQNSPSILTSLDFITKKRPIYQIKSLKYSIFYFMQYEEFIKILKESDMDYELYCQERDKIKNIPNQFQVFECQFCQKKHFKFECPKLHYFPYKQIIVSKYLHQYKTCKCKRYTQFERRKPKGITPMALHQRIQVELRKSPRLISLLAKCCAGNSDLSDEYKTRRNTHNLEESSENNSLSSLKAFSFEEDSFKKIIEDINFKVTQDVISNQFYKFKKESQFTDEVWILNLDHAHNFSGYFSTNNSYNLKNIFDLEKRMENKIKHASNLNLQNQMENLHLQVSEIQTSEEQNLRKVLIGE